MKKIFLLFLLIGIFTKVLAQNSVLNNGDWYKIGVTQTGIHKIDAAFLKNMGINTSGINPKNLRIYGNGGRMLPQKNADFRYNDLTENAVFVSGEADSKFDDSDFILFFAQSPHEIIADTNTNTFSHRFNIYSDTTYYFLTVSDQSGLRIQNQASFAGNAMTVNSFDAYFFYEKDNINLCKSGREWFDKDYFESVTERNYDFKIPGLVPNSDLKLAVSVAAGVTDQERGGADSSSFIFKINNTNVGKQGFGTLNTYKYTPRGILSNNIFQTTTSQTGTAETLSLTLNFNRGNGSQPAVGYVNYLGINAKRQLKLYDNQTTFRSFENLNQSVNFSFTADNALKIWDITNPLHPKEQAFTVNGSQANFAVAKSDTLREFIMFSGNGFEIPTSAGKISNQNLHSLATPDLLIIAADGLLSEAQRLAEFRRTNDKLNVAVVTVSQVFNEFSSGMQDVSAIRDFIRYLYKKGDLRYVLLFGDATYDYKNRISTRFSTAKNTIPVYESRSSLNFTETYSSDDYFGFMDENEGDWTEDNNNSFNHTLEIGIGRLTLENLTEAREVVNKLIYYSQNTKTLGKWRQKVSFVADDGDSNQHQADAEFLAGKVSSKDLEFTPNKLYLDNFKRVFSGGSDKVPDANAAVDRAVTEGSLIVNYSGHGGEIGWTQEQILTIPQMQNYRNLNNMPLFVTATCEFGRYDNPLQLSGAELLMLNAKGGGIGLLTTTRPVYSTTNLLINSAFYEAVFQPVSGKKPRLGDIMKNTKNNALSGVLNRNFTLLGDPSLRLAYPEQNIKITKINNKNTGTDTLSAMQSVTLQGEIQDANSLKISDFNGVLNLTVFDKSIDANTLGQTGVPMIYKVQDRILYEGKATVTNGAFSTNFVLPKDIDYRFGLGKISLYAQSNSEYSDAGGYLQQNIGGSAKNTPTDNTVPQIALFLDNENFVSGNTVSDSPVLIAQLSDENGINLSQIGLGHDITAVLDNQSESSISLNAFYTPDLDTYKSGIVRYNLKNLSEGNHTLTLKAWDVFNNSNSAKINFNVSKAGKITLQNVYVYPNPALSETIFRFEHDREGDDLEIEGEIFTVQGKSIKQWKTEVQRSEKVYDGYKWLISEENLAVGMYIYRLTVRSLTGNLQGQTTGRLVIIR